MRLDARNVVGICFGGIVMCARIDDASPDDEWLNADAPKNLIIAA